MKVRKKKAEDFVEEKLGSGKYTTSQILSAVQEYIGVEKRTAISYLKDMHRKWGMLGKVGLNTWEVKNEE